MGQQQDNANKIINKIMRVPGTGAKWVSGEKGAWDVARRARVVVGSGMLVLQRVSRMRAAHTREVTRRETSKGRTARLERLCLRTAVWYKTD